MHGDDMYRHIVIVQTLYHILINNRTHHLPFLGPQGSSHELEAYKRDLGFTVHY